MKSFFSIRNQEIKSCNSNVIKQNFRFFELSQKFYITVSISTPSLTIHLLNSLIWLTYRGIWEDFQYWSKWCSNFTKTLDKTFIRINKPNKDRDILYRFRFGFGLDYLNFFVFYSYPLSWYNIAKKANFIFMKMTLL